MDEVRARRALQRVAYAEDWLSRLKDDLAAGHNRDAMTHLLTAQAELALLSEQLAPALGWAEEPAVATAPVLASPAFGAPRRSPFAWASLAVACIALATFMGVLVPQRTTRTTPIQPISETGDPVLEALSAVPAIPAPVLVLPKSTAVESPVTTVSTELAQADPIATPTTTRPRTERRPKVTPSATVVAEPPALEPVAADTPGETPVDAAVSEPAPVDPVPADVSLEAFRWFRSVGER